MKRGEIYYIESSYNNIGSEQRAGRPAVIVSNNKNNENSSTVEVVYLTTQPKADLPTHVSVCGTGKESTALCEQVDTVAIERIGNWCGECSKTEMGNIDIALMISLDLTYEKEQKKDIETTKAPPVESVSRKLVATEAQLSIVQAMYSELLKQITMSTKG